MYIGELVRLIEATKPKPPPDDLLNGPHRACRCPSPCNGPLVEPRGKP